MMMMMKSSRKRKMRSKKRVQLTDDEGIINIVRRTEFIAKMMMPI